MQRKMPAPTVTARQKKFSGLQAIEEAPIKYNNISAQTSIGKSERNEMKYANDSVASLKASIADFHKSQGDGMNLANDSVASLKASIANFHKSQGKGMNLANDSVSTAVTASITNFDESRSTPVLRPQDESPIPNHINVKKKVNFDKQIVKHYVLSKTDMAPEERENYWCNKVDDRNTFMQAKLTVRMIMKGMPFDDVENCSRGLESKTQSESKKRVRNKKKAATALLSEQERQRLQGTRNPERLAHVVRKHTKELADLATEIAAQDEKDAKQILASLE